MDAALNASARFAAGACARLVVKIGSSLLVENGAVRREWLASVVADIAERRAAGQQVVVVSSGAIALGARRLKLEKGGRASLEDAQAAAAVGQVALSAVWEALLSDAGLTMAQVLLTLGDLEDRRRYLNVSATLERLLALGAVPVLNENDTVATTEIRFGDNDRLAARAAQAAGAAGVILLSDVDGLYTANPGRDPTAQLVPEVLKLTAEIEAMADGGSASGLGSGGMAAKLAAAKIAGAAGIHLAIADGRVVNPLQKFADTGRGTVFVAGEGARAKKAWLAGRLTVHGTLTVDAGAVAALQRGKSLLAAGVTGVTGAFSRGDVVAISGPDGVMARGLSAYDAGDAGTIKGLRNDVQAAALGYAPRAAMVHADHLVLI